MRKTLFVLFIVSLLPAGIYGQFNKDAKKLWDKSKPLLDSGRYKECVPVVEKAISKENAESNKKKDSLFLVQAYKRWAECYYHLGKWDSALIACYEGAETARKIRDTTGAAGCIMLLNDAYAMASSDTIYFNIKNIFHKERNNTVYNMTRIRSLVGGQKNRPAGDTIWFYCGGGSNDGVFVNARCGFHSIYKPPGNKDRKFHYYGSGYITWVSEQESYGYAVLKEDFNDTVYKNDGIYVQMEMPATKPQSELYNLTLMDYRLYNYFLNRYYIYPTTTYYVLDDFYEQALYKTMLDEIHNNHKRLAIEAAYTYLDSVISSGRFKGKTLGQALSMTEQIDLDHFLNYKSTYRSSNYNKEESLISAYLVWLYGGTYTGANEQTLWNYLLKTPENKSDEFTKTYYGYYENYDAIDSIWGSWIDTINDPSQARQITMCKHIIKFAEMSDSLKKKGFWYEQLTNAYHKKKDYANCYETALKWYTTGWRKNNALVIISMAANMVKDYDAAIRYGDSILNHEAILFTELDSVAAKNIIIEGCVEKGFGMLMNGKIRPALPVLEKGFLLDSMQRFARFTYANGLALNGKLDEARRHYDVCLTLLVSSNEFQFMIDDWNMFIQNGNLADFFVGEKIRLGKIYDQKYKYRLIIDSFITVGYYLRKNQNDLQKAIKQYGYALDICKEHLAYDSAKLVFILDWLGYIASEIDQDSLSLEYYLEAVNTCEKYKFNDDQISTEYDNVTYIAKHLMRWDLYRQYMLKSDELKNKMREQQRKRLFILSCGTNVSTQTKIQEKYAEKDVTDFTNALKEPGTKYFDTVIVRTLLGKNLKYDSLNNTFKRIIEQAEENDVFVFYYAGPSGENERYAQLNLANDFYTVSEISGYLSQVRCLKQIMVLDGGNMPVDSVNTYLKDFSPSYKDNSSFFVTNKNWRTENKDGHGALTGAMLEYLNNQNTDAIISAQSLLNGTTNLLNEKSSAYALQSVSQGYEIILGRKTLTKFGRDTTPPQISLPDAIIVRADNIVLKQGKKTALTGFITDDRGVELAFVNGQEVSLADNGRFTIPFSELKSDTVVITAVDISGNKTTIKAIVNRSVSSTLRSSRKIAWLFATDSFDNWKDLNNPVFDVQDLGSILKDFYGYEVHYVLNKDWDGIQTALDEMKADHYATGDQLLIYYASHGYYHESRGVLVACADAEDPKGGKFNNYLPGSTLMYYVRSINCNNIFLVMDICYAGMMATEQNIIKYKQQVSQGTLTDREFIQRQLSIRCSQFLISGRSNPVNDGVKGSHSPFANAVIQNLLNGATNKAFVSLDDLRLNLPQTGTNADWRPIYGFWDRDDDGEFLMEVMKRPSSPAAMHN